MNLIFCSQVNAGQSQAQQQQQHQQQIIRQQQQEQQRLMMQQQQYMNNTNNQDYGAYNRKPQQQQEIKLDQVPVALKPNNIPTDKENFEAELISKIILIVYLLKFFSRVFVGFLF